MSDIDFLLMMMNSHYAKDLQRLADTPTEENKMENEMDKKDKELKIIQLEPTDTVEEEHLDLTNTTERFTTTIRLVFMEYMGEDADDEIDAETVKLSYQLARELKYAISDCGEDMELYLHVFLETLFDEEQSPYHRDWLELFSDDEMRINALRIIQSVQYAVCQLFMAKMHGNLMKEDNDEKEK
jgi:hypothetical protein